MLTQDQELFIALTKEAEKLSEKLKEVNKQKDEIALSLGVGSHFQDPLDKTVFQIIEPNGGFE